MNQSIPSKQSMLEISASAPQAFLALKLFHGVVIMRAGSFWP
jgi:hypothetical protein